MLDPVLPGFMFYRNKHQREWGGELALYVGTVVLLVACGVRRVRLEVDFLCLQVSVRFNSGRAQVPGDDAAQFIPHHRTGSP